MFWMKVSVDVDESVFYPPALFVSWTFGGTGEGGEGAPQTDFFFLEGGGQITNRPKPDAPHEGLLNVEKREFWGNFHDVRFYPTRNFGYFWAPSFKHPNTKHLKPQNVKT